MSKVVHAHQILRKPSSHMPVIHEVLKVMAEMRVLIEEGNRDTPVFLDYDRKLRDWISRLEKTHPEKCLKGSIDVEKRKKLAGPKK